MTPNGNVVLRATCPRCFGPIETLIPEAENGKHVEFIVCKGPCRRTFGAWPEHQWSEPESRPIPPELTIILDEGAPTFHPAAA